MMARSELKKFKKKAWNLCSLYHRLKHADRNGYVTCYTCGVRKHYKDGIQAGHAFAGRGKEVLFMDEVIRPQCVGCNMFQGGKLDVFTYKLRKELGDKRFEELYLKAHGDRGQWKRWELEELIERYKKLNSVTVAGN